MIIVIAFQKETYVELGSLLRSEALSVYNQLLLYLSVSYDKVFSGLAMLALKDDTYTGPKDLKTTQHLVSCYKRNFCGYRRPMLCAQDSGIAKGQTLKVGDFNTPT